MGLPIETGTVNGWTVVVPAGEVDVATAPRLRQALLELVDTGHLKIVVDFAKIEFIDSAGLGVLVEIRKRSQTVGGEVVLAAMAPGFHKLFEVTGLAEAFQIESTVEAATNS